MRRATSYNNTARSSKNSRKPAKVRIRKNNRKNAPKLKIVKDRPAPLPLSDQPWTQEKFQAFASEIEAIGKEVRKKIGKKDVEYINKFFRTSRKFEIVGRLLIHTSLDPFTWFLGVLSLWVHLQLITAEINHHRLHGSWDGLEGAERFYSNTKWDLAVEEKAWKRGHNILHHQFTNIVGKDPDVSFGFMRTSEKTPWSFHHLFQLSQFFISAPIFWFALNPYFSGFGDLFHRRGAPGHTDILPDKKIKTFIKAGLQSAKKLVPYCLYHFGFWPLLAGPFWWKVLGGNLFAEALRNIFTAAIVYPGHFGDDVSYYDKSYKPHGKGEWYKSQIEATHDFYAPPFLRPFTGAMDFQIEHHLFPKLPPNRVREIAPKIKAICEKFGVSYQNPTWGQTLKIALKRIAKFSLP